MTKTYPNTVIRFVNSVYGESNALNLIQTKKITYDLLAQYYIDELAKHGSKVFDLQNTIHRLNNPLPSTIPPYERSIYNLENWMRRVITERWKAGK
mgnify:CR=1 FL=1